MFCSLRASSFASLAIRNAVYQPARTFTCRAHLKMPEKVSAIDASRDPATSKQYDDKSTNETKFKDFYELVDSMNVGMMGTYRVGEGPVSRSMGVAKRSGPDFLFLANANSQKFKDLEQYKEVNLTFENSSNKDWDPFDNIFVTMPPWHPVSTASNANGAGKAEKEKAVKNPVSHWRLSRRSVVGKASNVYRVCPWLISPDFVYRTSARSATRLSEGGM